jgi:hypothetical protein
MKPVTRDEVLGLAAYEQIRDQFRARVIELKKVRRVALGPNMSALFENRDTVLFQIQEMLRTERITSEKAVLHEIETYNELVPGERELSATVFVEYTDAEERERMLTKLAGLEDDFYIEVRGERLPVVPDHRNERTDRTLAVHYVKFLLTPSAVEAVRAREPVTLGVEHPAYRAATVLSGPLVAALAEDLAS